LGLFDSDKIPLSNTNSLAQIKINKTYLTKREIECLQLTIKGYTAKRIARQLGISHRTVEEYLVNIRIKTGTSSKAELIEMTIDHLMPY
jgi:DNA-binding CsgD family transcriptional regulator